MIDATPDRGCARDEVGDVRLYCLLGLGAECVALADVYRLATTFLWLPSKQKYLDAFKGRLAAFRIGGGALSTATTDRVGTVVRYEYDDDESALCLVGTALGECESKPERNNLTWLDLIALDTVTLAEDHSIYALNLDKANCCIQLDVKDKRPIFDCFVYKEHGIVEVCDYGCFKA